MIYNKFYFNVFWAKFYFEVLRDLKIIYLCHIYILNYYIFMNLELAKSLLSFIAPDVVIENFELVSIKENTEYFILKFEENESLVPSELSCRDFKLNGFENKLELHTFPQKGKSCYLNIYRRKWVDKQTGKTYSNDYNLHKKGMKATNELGEFLKKNNRNLSNTI